VAFDFAVLRRPIVYIQHDRETFYAGHSYEPGYYDYDRDGFGPVCTDYETTISTIIRIIETGCQLDDQYRRRVESFFPNGGESCCAAVIDAILELG